MIYSLQFLNMVSLNLLLPSVSYWFCCSMLMKVLQRATCCKVSVWYVSRSWVPAASRCLQRLLAITFSTRRASTVTLTTAEESLKRVGRNARASVVRQRKKKFLKYAHQHIHTHNCFSTICQFAWVCWWCHGCHLLLKWENWPIC